MLFVVVSLLPVAWVFRSRAVGRIVGPGELFVPPPEVFPGGFSLLPYVSVLYDLDFLRPLFNGLITAATTAMGCFLIGSMAAYAMGITEEEIHQPWVGVATCWNEAAPCNIALSRQAQSVKSGVKEGGGTPREFTTITVTDGIAMGHQGMKSSLASRDAIADTVELTVRGHCYDALVGLAGCDKSLPGMMMAMLRLNVPSVFMYGGSILPGNFHGKDVTVQDVYEAVGGYQAGQISADELHALMAPPDDSIMEREIGSPMPMPLLLVVKKLSNRRA